MSTALQTMNTNASLLNAGSSYAELTDAQVFDMFLRGRTENTRRKYERDLLSLYVWLDGRSFRDVDLPALQQWSSLQTGAEKTKRERIATIRSFYAWSTRLGILRVDPAAELQQPQARQTLHTRLLTDDERDSVLRAATNDRDRILLDFLFRSGVRVSELCDLRVRDVRFDVDGTCLVDVYRSKTGTTTTQPYSPTSSVARNLRGLVAGRRPDDYLFRSTGVPASIASRAGQNVDGKLTTSAVFRIVRAAAVRANVDRSVSPHWLRHSCGTFLASKGATPHQIAAWLGHGSLQTSMSYVHIVGRQMLQVSQMFGD